MEIKSLALYFLIGGAVVAAITYFGAHAKSEIAALIGMLPSITLVSLCTIYLAGGKEVATSYAKDLMKFVPPWVLYVLVLIFLLPRIGLVGSLAVGVGVYLGTAFLIMRLT